MLEKSEARNQKSETENPREKSEIPPSLEGHGEASGNQKSEELSSDPLSEPLPNAEGETGEQPTKVATKVATKVEEEMSPPLAKCGPLHVERGSVGSVERVGVGPLARPSTLSALQMLPRERQEELFEYSGTHAHKETVQWLAEGGVSASHAAITRFRRWFHRCRLREDDLAFTREMVEERRRNEPDISEEELALFGRKVFARLAIDAEDGTEWARQQLVRQREIKLEQAQGRLKLARQKFEFDAAAACLKHFPVIRLIVKDSGLSEPQKIDKIHEALFPKPGGKGNGIGGMTNAQCQMTKQ